MDWTKLADDDTIEKTAKALKERGFDAIIVGNGEEAKRRALEMIPKKAEVMNATSITLEELGIVKEIEESGEYDSVRKKIKSVSDENERNEMRKRTMSPEYVIGSVHAVTEDGQVIIASASGSQIPPYVFGAKNVIWVVGTQKIVKNLDDALKRVYEHALPLESERVHKVYGMPHSSVSKILIYERERPGRVRLIFVKERLGF